MVRDRLDRLCVPLTLVSPLMAQTSRGMRSSRPCSTGPASSSTASSASPSSSTRSVHTATALRASSYSGSVRRPHDVADAAQELSTIPLNINWFLDKTGQTGSTLQMINGAALLLSFFGVRLAMGVWSTWYFASNLFSDRVRAKMAPGTPLLYFAALMSLNCACTLQCALLTRPRPQRLLVPRDDPVAAQALRQVGARQVEAVSVPSCTPFVCPCSCALTTPNRPVLCSVYTREPTDRDGHRCSQTRKEARGDGRGRAIGGLPACAAVGRDLRTTDAA